MLNEKPLPGGATGPHRTLSPVELDLLAVLRSDGPAARADLARATGRSTATISRALQRLRSAGLVRERAVVAAGRGRPPRVVELRADAACVVGIDAGGSMLRAVRADLEGVVRARAARPARDTSDAQALLDDLFALVGQVHRSDGSAGPRLLAVVAGVSGIVDHASGRVLVSPDLPGLEGVALAEELGSRLGVPAAIDNDDLLAAIGEASTGAACGCRDVTYLSFGYGLGAGLIVDGRPVRGASSSAGAIAYLSGGGLERRASGRSLPVRLAEARTAAGFAPAAVATSTRLDARAVFELAASGEPTAGSVVSEAIRAIGEAVVDVAALLDPEVIVLGGGISSAGGAVLTEVEARLAAALPYPPRIVTSALGDAAVVEGAVSMALALGRRAAPSAPTPGRTLPARPPALVLAGD